MSLTSAEAPLSMASPKKHPRRSRQPGPKEAACQGKTCRAAAARLLAVERSAEVFPVLLEEVVAAGYPRAFVLQLDGDSGKLVPVSSLNCSKAFLSRVRAALSAARDPFTAALHTMRPAVLSGAGLRGASLSCHPLVLHQEHPCVEAGDGARRGSCLAFLNRRPLPLQACSVCGLRSYAALLAVELTPASTARDLRALRALAGLANRALTRLLKAGHDSSRIAGLEASIARLQSEVRDLNARRSDEEANRAGRMREIEQFAAVGRLAATIAHEVNNPLEAIKNCLYLLGGAVRHDREEVYRILKDETERLSRIVRQMLGLCRGAETAGPVDVNAVLQDTLLLFSRQLQRAGVRLTLELGKLPPVTGSGDQLRQVFSNLVVNARDSMAQGGGRLRVRTRLLAPRGLAPARVRIFLADTGCGIPRHLWRSIFDPFFTTKGDTGTGLGLWIARGIVEDHGGAIAIRSRERHGTVIRIDLPAVRA
jgi:signal transduction histidine kinase